ncbi:hypothetical protein NEIFLAOT_02486 [Neisseria flavescens NRL30031/H210]|uniref:Uncharacterized protein n=1 Tax=Neisseria flavescens NRL30031/H210 TaxID=546264 RepID=C0ER86_NEIFL|nr:hypothetical protein NEIFLAOT_02486 [Neisseria flavescens NRL30031/H210]
MALEATFLHGWNNQLTTKVYRFQTAFLRIFVYLFLKMDWKAFANSV